MDVWGAIFGGVISGVVSSHDLRHHRASLLIRSGCALKAVQSFGARTAAETLDTYWHLWPDDEDRIRAAFDAALDPIGGVRMRR